MGVDLDPNQDDIEMVTPAPDNAVVTPSATARRGGTKRKKTPQLKRRAAFEKKCAKKLLALKETLKPVPFTPVLYKTLDFNRHESLLKRLGLWDFIHMEFDPLVRMDLIAQLIANYNPTLRYSYVNGVRILVNRADLSRALRITWKKEKSVAASDGSMEARVEKESEESIKIVEEIVSNWMLLHGDTWCLPEDVVKMTRPMRKGNLEKMDWAGLIWCMMEKELSAAPKLENCYYATYMQCLIKTQKEELLRMEVKVDLDEDCDGDVSMSDTIDATIETMENTAQLSGEEDHAVDLKEGVENESTKEENENVEKEEHIGDGCAEKEDKVRDEGAEKEDKVGDEGVEKNDNLRDGGAEKEEKIEDECVEKEDKLGDDEDAEKEDKLKLGDDEGAELRRKLEVVDVEKKEKFGDGDNVEEEVDGHLGNEKDNVLKEEKDNVVKKESEYVRKEEMDEVGNETVKDVVENELKEFSLVEEVIKFEGTKKVEGNGQFLDGSKSGVKEPFLRRCDLGDFDGMDFEEHNQTHLMEGEEEGGQREGEDEEEDDDDEDEQEHDGAFLLSIGGEALEGSGNLIQGMGTDPQFPFSSGVQICDNDFTADFLGSRVDHSRIPGCSSHFGQNSKRMMDLDNEGPHNSINGSSRKRMKHGGAWENKTTSEFDTCLDQSQHWMQKARMMYMQKEQTCNELSSSQQLLINELNEQEATIQHLHKLKFEEQQRKKREICRLERELFIMTDLLDGYRKALKAVRDEFAEYRARFPQFDVPLYGDVPGGGGLMLTCMDLEKRRLKQEEEERMNRLLIENKIKDFEAESMAKFEAHRCVVESLNDRLLNVEKQIELLRGLLANRKVPDWLGCAAPT